MTSAVERLRKILALERQRRFANTAVVGGLDAFLLRFAQDAGIPYSHQFSKVLRGLPPGGYRALHPIQRARVVDALLAAATNGFPAPEQKPAPAPQPAGLTLVKSQVGPPERKRGRSVPAPAAALVATLDSPVTALKGVSRATAEKLARRRIGVSTIRDLLYLLPERYEAQLGVRPIEKLEYDRVQTVVGDVWSVGTPLVGRKKISEAFISDRTGTVRAIWWSGPWMAKRFREGMRVALTGRVKAFRNRLQMENPEVASVEEESILLPRVVPVYPATEGLEQRQIRPLAQVAVETFVDRVEDPLPEELRRRLELPGISEALRQVHLPASLESAERGRKRLAFDELACIELGVIRRRKDWQAAGGASPLALPKPIRDGFESSLPFSLTDDQMKAIDEVLTDIGREVPMNRLVEGDVGTGKTAVAALALLAAVVNGYQGAIMAPTEILADQLYRTFCSLLDPRIRDRGDNELFVQEAGPGYVVLRPPYLEREVRIALLRGSQKAAAKSATQVAIAGGEVDIAVGTHALIQQAVGFDRLALVVVDEQHRFGVEQRAALRGKGGAPHVLAMTATPIPRTLALTVYGDLDISVLQQAPAGRPPVKTWLVNSRRAAEAYEFIRRKVSDGKQAYVICPLVEESETVEAKAAVQEYERLARDVFPELRLGLLHGRMSGAEKDATMRAFRAHDLDILVSTAVVEVGIDVPNATVMLIEGADRFGLSQLHQFRGRVRRSVEQAYCFLLSDNAEEDAQERLRIMETTSDGLTLAEHDLRIRGPGEYFGTRQSGMPDLRAASLADVDLIAQAREEATRLLEADPDLARPEHAALRAEVAKLWSRLTAEVS